LSNLVALATYVTDLQTNKSESVVRSTFFTHKSLDKLRPDLMKEMDELRIGVGELVGVHHSGRAESQHHFLQPGQQELPFDERAEFGHSAPRSQTEAAEIGMRRQF